MMLDVGAPGGLASTLRRDWGDKSSEVEHWKEVASRAERDLAEVVDECVFAEKERKRAEDALRVASSQFSVDRSLLSALDAALVYISILEHQILLPAVTSVGSVVANAAAESRSDLEQRLELVNCLVGAETPFAVRRALASTEAPSATAAAQMKRSEWLNAAPPLNVTDSYVAALSMMSTAHLLRGQVKEAMGALSSYTASMASPGVASSDDATDVARKEYHAALASIRESRELLDQAIRMRDDGPMVSKMAQRVQELEHIIQQFEDEREEVAKRFAVLQRAIESAKDAERERDHTAVQHDELVMLQMQCQHQSATIQTQQDELLTMGRELRELRRTHEDEIQQLKQQLARAMESKGSAQVDSFFHRMTTTQPYHSADVPTSSSASSPDVSLQPAGNNGASTQQLQHAFQTKIRALDMTVAALNAEIASLEDKLVALQRKADDETADHARALAACRGHHQEELEECDAVVEKMAAELESLIQENTALRQRLRSTIR